MWKLCGQNQRYKCCECVHCAQFEIGHSHSSRPKLFGVQTQVTIIRPFDLKFLNLLRFFFFHSVVVPCCFVAEAFNGWWFVRRKKKRTAPVNDNASLYVSVRKRFNKPKIKPLPYHYGQPFYRQFNSLHSNVRSFRWAFFSLSFSLALA